MVQIEVGAIGGEQIAVGESRAVVRGGVAGNGERGLDGAREGGAREVGGARVAALLAEIDRHPDALVAVVFDRLHLAAAYRDGLTDPLGHLGLRA